MSTAAPPPRLPLLKPWYRLARTADGVLLEHGRATVTFGGAASTVLLPVLLPLLDGERTVDEIVDTLGRAAAPAVENALELLDRNGLLTDGPALSPRVSRLERTAVYLAQSSADPPSMILERLSTACVLVEGDRELAASVGRLLRRSGVVHATTAPEPTFVVTAAALAGDPVVEQRNGKALAEGGAWLPVGCFDGRAATIGPLVVPHETACYRCYEIRRNASTACAPELASLRSTPLSATGGASLVALVSAIAAERVLRWLAHADPNLPSTAVTVEAAPGFAVAEDVVLRVPRCPACSGLGEAGQPVPWHEQPWERE